MHDRVKLFFLYETHFFLSFWMCLLGRAGSSRALRDGWGQRGEKFNFGSPSRSPNSYKNEREPRDWTFKLNSPEWISIHQNHYSNRGTKILRSANSTRFHFLIPSIHPNYLYINFNNADGANLAQVYLHIPTQSVFVWKRRDPPL